MSKFVSHQDYANIEAVSAAYPVAVEIIKVDGGWMVFGSKAEARSWFANLVAEPIKQPF